MERRDFFKISALGLIAFKYSLKVPFIDSNESNISHFELIKRFSKVLVDNPKNWKKYHLVLCCNEKTWKGPPIEDVKLTDHSIEFIGQSILIEDYVMMTHLAIFNTKREFVRKKSFDAYIVARKGDTIYVDYTLNF